MFSLFDKSLSCLVLPSVIVDCLDTSVVCVTWRTWRLVRWTMSGLATSGCQVLVCRSIEVCSWSVLSMHECSNTSQRRTSAVNWKWLTASIGLFLSHSPPVDYYSYDDCVLITELFHAMLCVTVVPNCMCLHMSSCYCVIGLGCRFLYVLFGMVLIKKLLID